LTNTAFAALSVGEEHANAKNPHQLQQLKDGIIWQITMQRRRRRVSVNGPLRSSSNGDARRAKGPPQRAALIGTNIMAGRKNAAVGNRHVE
jgi:hypothetical protein